MSLDPVDQRLRQRQRLFRQLAVAAALGFVLLLPLQLSAGLRQQSAAGSAQVNAVFDQAQAQINRDRAALPPVTAATALPELLRTSLACLLLATAFAGFARRAGVELSLLEEMQQRLRWLRLRPGRAKAVSDVEYVRKMAGDRQG